MTTTRRMTWPMQPGGGLFLVCVGFGIATGAILGRPINGLAFGLLVGFVCIAFSIVFFRKHFGRPTMSQYQACYGAIILEIGAFAAAGQMGFLSSGFYISGIVGLTIVALHFIVMRWSHGPWMLHLAAALLAWIGLAYGLKLSTSWLWIGDGLLKIAFGIIMASPIFIIRRAAPVA